MKRKFIVRKKAFKTFKPFNNPIFILIDLLFVCIFFILDDFDALKIEG